ncbi:MAG: TrpB-like pyridoxal phosphate-dependent enzyme [Candidatus Margulisbacteria bacterium]|nr:TrpB-like pyridoxal phosphate-dependent enzyme [Candidatus Margulisiibacteriota bacterium]
MQRKITLTEKEMPKQWYNILADLSSPIDPPLHPVTLKPATPEVLAEIFPMALIEQEMSTERWIDIPAEIMDKLSIWRPSPLYRAYELEKALGTPAKIYYKWEGVSPAGSHKPNTAIAQAYYNKKEGINKLSTETGAGQWGSSLALAGSMFGIEVLVYMVKCSFDMKPSRRLMMETWGAKCISSPSNTTDSGRQILQEDPNCLGSLGIAISEAVEVALKNKDTNYALGSVLNHVLLHQSVIGLECKEQLKKVGDYPDVVIGCVGGGSNFGGIATPFAYDKIHGSKNVRLVAVEPTACPTLTKGIYAYDYGDTAKMAPVMKMHTLGHDFIPASIHAGGLRYHGMAPIISKLVKENLVEAVAYHQRPVFDAAILFAKTEGHIIAPESAHAVKGAIDEALKAKEEGKERTILFNCSGHGHFDLSSYQKFFDNQLEDFDYPDDLIKKALLKLPKVK